MKVIIVGAGAVGYHIAGRLAFESKDVVLIDKDPEALRRVAENLDVQIMNASGSSPRVLEAAGIKKADILLAVTDSDEVNLAACLAANLLSPTTKKLARLRNEDFDPYHQAFHREAPHIDTVINPEIEVVKSIYRLMKIPGAVDIGELAEGRVKFMGMPIEHDSPLVGILLADFKKLFGDTRPLLAGLVRDGKLIVPKGEDRIQAGDLVYFISLRERLEETLALFNKSLLQLKRVVIVGGGRIGQRLASALEKDAIQTKIIEADRKRCNLLAENSGKTIILHGDGSDQKLLLEENVGEADVVAALTQDEQTNILVSLLATNLGAKNVITKVNRLNHSALMTAIGLKTRVSTKLSAVSSILREIRKGKILSAVSILDEDAEILEAIALETSDITNRPLKKLSFPRDAILLCLIRKNLVIIPTGESLICPGDRMIIFALRRAIKKLEKMLTVALEYF